jgi:serine/threonine protein kinase
VVYRAVHQHKPEVEVAIRRLSPALAEEPNFLASLTEECEKLRKVHHPNVVSFRELLVSGGSTAIIREYVNGESAEKVLDRNPIAIRYIPQIGFQILLGFVAAQEKGLLHGDMRPADLFLHGEKKNKVKIEGFGLMKAAKAAGVQILWEHDPRYMAPELFDGAELSAASDVYSIGLTLWSLLTGRSACPDGALDEKMQWHQSDPLTDIRVFRPECPSVVVGILRSFCEKDPKKRVQNAAKALQIWREKVMTMQPTFEAATKEEIKKGKNSPKPAALPSELAGFEDDQAEETISLFGPLEVDPTEVTEKIEPIPAPKETDPTPPATKSLPLPPPKKAKIGPPKAVGVLFGRFQKLSLQTHLLIAVTILFSQFGLVTLGFYISELPDTVVEEEKPSPKPKPPADGRVVYKEVCSTCHKFTGKGMPGVYPPLAASEWLAKGPDVAIRVVLHGLKGKIVVKGVEYDQVMSPWGNALTDEQIANVLTYAGNSWGNRIDKVTPGQVAKLRKEYEGHGLWTSAELIEE